MTLEQQRDIPAEVPQPTTGIDVAQLQTGAIPTEMRAGVGADVPSDFPASQTLLAAFPETQQPQPGNADVPGTSIPTTNVYIPGKTTIQPKTVWGR